MIEVKLLITVLDEEMVVATLSISDLWLVPLCFSLPEDGVAKISF